MQGNLLSLLQRRIKETIKRGQLCFGPKKPFLTIYMFSLHSHLCMIIGLTFVRTCKLDVYLLICTGNLISSTFLSSLGAFTIILLLSQHVFPFICFSTSITKLLLHVPCFYYLREKSKFRIIQEAVFDQLSQRHLPDHFTQNYYPLLNNFHSLSLAIHY